MKQLSLPCSLSEATTLHGQLQRLENLCTRLYDEQHHLQDQLDSANEAYHRKHAELAAAHAEIALLQTNLDVARRLIFHREPAVPAWLNVELRRVIALAHPDKWSQGQEATTLAHEVTAAVNALRERLGEGRG